MATKKTEVAVKTNGTVAPFDAAKYRAGIANMRKAAASRADFLRMDKQGDWYYGVDDNPVGASAKLYVDPNGSVHGWQCWANTDLDGVQADLLKQVIGPMHEPMPECPDELPKNGRPWAPMCGLSMLLDGHKLTYTTTSVGGLDAVAKFGTEFGEQLDTDESKPIAIVNLGNDWYKHKKWGKTYVPVFKVLGWTGTLPAEAVAPAKGAAKKASAKAVAAPAKSPVRRAAAR